ncbi:hypothetical protein BGW36DRAFT_406450 [Talaromyces proteolyticus]|uniref:t-SNARE coiled-coil homology domain-containing protein n=1 Tax=Talaromyces proteolyticus TaxID=1131652 RepID=A0AAD4KTG1_9EURO|nr:uncharacterized protein BGW36DRAFT_406450 [Talaromyces proteolyticus]KAH8698485.1 hypothetical protein BGW36DRAFT_406450 [Talaromyces proteolyticus]
MAVASTTAATDSTSTIDIVNLNNLLSRLEQNIFSSSSDLRILRQSHLHRARVGANVDYAHTLFTRLERGLPSIKSAETRHARTADLAKKRARLARLRERFDGLKDDDTSFYTGGDEDGDGLEEEEGEGEDLLAGIVEPVESVVKKQEEDEQRRDKAAESLDKGAGKAEAAVLRQRRQDSTAVSAPVATAATTGFKPTPISSTTKPDMATATAESNLSSHRAEQESLTDSLVNLASQLKASSQAFQTSLENEKSVLDRAVEGLDRNVSGLEAAGKRMGVLRRMSEGRGWLGRMLMYAWIFGLWLVAIAIVYLGPKLRF